MIVIWVIMLFLWLYSIPFILVSCCVWTPFLAVTLPFCYYVNSYQDHNPSFRDLVNGMPYSWWFGSIKRITVPETPCLITSHPHGIFCTGILVGCHLQPNSRTKFAVSPWLFCIPIVGMLATFMGCIPANEEAISNALKDSSVILVPGGVPELVTQTLYTRRYGFLRIAKKCNVPIVPVVTGSKFYSTLPLPFKGLRTYIARHYGIPLMCPWVFGYMGTWVPKRVPVLLEQLEPINVEGDIPDAHKVYFNHLCARLGRLGDSKSK